MINVHFCKDGFAVFLCIAFVTTFLLFSCNGSQQKPNQQAGQSIHSPHTRPQPFTPVVQKGHNGKWAPLFSPAESYEGYFLKNYFPQRSQDLVVDRESIVLLEDSMNAYQAMRPYLMARGYDSGIEKEVFLRMQLSQWRETWGLYSSKQNTLEVFLCEAANLSCKLIYSTNGNIDGCIDPLTGKRCKISQYVIE